MTFKESNINRDKLCKNQRFVQDFIDSGLAQAEVVYADAEYASAASCGNAVSVTCKRFYNGEVICFMRDGKVYLERLIK